MLPLLFCDTDTSPRQNGTDISHNGIMVWKSPATYCFPHKELACFHTYRAYPFHSSHVSVLYHTCSLRWCKPARHHLWFHRVIRGAKAIFRRLCEFKFATSVLRMHFRIHCHRMRLKFCHTLHECTLASVFFSTGVATWHVYFGTTCMISMLVFHQECQGHAHDKKRNFRKSHIKYWVKHVHISCMNLCHACISPTPKKRWKGAENSMLDRWDNRRQSKKCHIPYNATRNKHNKAHTDKYT